MNTPPLHEQLGRAFAYTVRAHLLDNGLEAELVKEIDERNAGYAANGQHGICATHEYMDANVTMMQAFRMVMGREQRITSEDEAGADEDAALWNKAWAYASRQGFAKLVEFIETDPTA